MLAEGRIVAYPDFFGLGIFFEVAHNGLDYARINDRKAFGGCLKSEVRLDQDAALAGNERRRPGDILRPSPVRDGDSFDTFGLDHGVVGGVVEKAHIHIHEESHHLQHAGAEEDRAEQFRLADAHPVADDTDEPAEALLLLRPPALLGHIGADVGDLVVGDADRDKGDVVAVPVVKFRDELA